MEVSVYILSSEIIEKVQSDDIGAWLLSFNTTPLEEGLHNTKSIFQLNEKEKSGFSQTLTFNLGKEVPGGLNPVCPYADLNLDGKINLIDFSVLLYWWGKDYLCSDQNQDGKVNLPDFSIMMYYWTG